MSVNTRMKILYTIIPTFLKAFFSGKLLTEKAHYAQNSVSRVSDLTTKTLILSLSVVFSFFTLPVKAEGSKELVAYGGYRPYIEFTNANMADIKRQTVMKVFVNAGEQVNLGSSTYNTDDDMDIVYRSPDGSQDGSCDVLKTGFGLIDSLSKEQAGPLPNTGGYTPCSFIAKETGIYEIEFRSSLIKGGYKAAPARKTTDSFTVDDTPRSIIIAWDVTVFKTPDDAQTEQKGRLYTNYLPISMAGFRFQIYSIFFVLNKMGQLYRINFNGIKPFRFIFFSNNKGFKDAADDNGVPLFKSVLFEEINKTVFVHNPADPDTVTDITNKIFFNPPASDLPLDVEVKLPGAGNTTWLLSNTPPLPKITDFKFTGIEGTANQAGTSPLSGIFSFKSEMVGRYILTLDLNHNGKYGDENDRLLIGNAKFGDNSIAWDGLDGKGEALLAQNNAYDASINLVAGDVHFPFFDIEENKNGLIIENVECDPLPCVAVDSLVYYNNAELTGGESQPDPIAALNGIDSSKGIQKFIGFGDDKAIDTWASLGEPLQLDNIVQLKQADLSVSKTHATELIPLPGGPMTYTITVRNAGPSDVTGIKVQDNLPATITEPIWRCEVSDSAPASVIQNACAETDGNGAIDTTVDLQNGATATFTLNATISDGVAIGDTITNSVTITRPNDVRNPQGTEADVKSETATDSFTLPTPANKPPVANDKSTATTNDTPVAIPALEATDDDGSVANYTVFNLPDSNQGLVYLGPPDSGTLVTEGQVLSAADIGNLYFQPESGFNGDVLFNYKATDDQGAVSNTANVTITVTSPPTNNPPVADDKQTPETPNDSTVSIPALSATDTDGSIASYTIESLPNESEGTLYFGNPEESGTAVTVGQTVLVNQAANLFFKPNTTFTGDSTFTYTATDNQGATSNTATVTVPVTGANQPPVAIDKTAASTPNNITVSLPPLEATDEGSVESYEIQSLPPESEGIVYLGDPAKGGKPLRVNEILTPAQIGELFFKPNTAFTGQSQFTYTATDNHNAVSNTATVSLPVTAPPNHPPIANDNSANTEPNTPVNISILDDDSDPDANLDPSSVKITTPPAQGEALPNSEGTVNYTPDSGLTTGSDQFTYEVCDTGSPKLCDTAEVTVNITNQKPPIADNKTADSTLNTQTVKVPTLSATDDGLVMFYSIATLPLPEHGVLYLNSPDDGGEPVTVGQDLTLEQIEQLYFKPNSGFMGGNASFTYTATDNVAAVSSSALVTLPVTVPVNSRPVANDDKASTDPETPVTIAILNNDSDPEGALDSSTVTITQDPPNGQVTVSPEGEAVYTPNPGFTTGTDLFTYQVCDSGMPQQCDTAVVTVTVPVSGNKPPVTENKTVPSIPNNTTVPLPSLSGNDEDGNVTAYTIETIPPESQGLLYLGDPAQGGTLIKPGQSLTPDEIDNLYFQPNENFTGQATFTYSATDNQGAVSNAALVTLPVEAGKGENQPPVATEDRASTDPETPVNIPILQNDTDPEGNLDPKSVTITTPPSDGTVSKNPDGTVIYTPNPGFTTGNDTFIYEVCDAGNPFECTSAVVTVTVPTSGDQPPVAENKNVPAISNDSTAQIPTLSATDDNTIISYTIATLPQESQGVLYLGDPEAGGTPITVGQVLTVEQIKTLFFKPKSDFTGNATFTYTATDNLGKVSSPALVTIPVTGPSNSPPIANDSRVTIEPETPATLTILKNDSDPNGNLDASSVKIVTQPTHGQVTVNSDGTITYTPDADFTQDSFTYQVCDSATPPLCDEATVEMSLPNPEPTAGNLIVTLQGNGQVHSYPEAIECHTADAPCSHTFPINTEVTLRAIPDTDWVFEGWRGHCDELGQVTIDSIKQCQAVFTPNTLQQLNLKVSRKGLGTVQTQPTGINCGSDCSEQFATGTQVDLTAVPAPGFAFIEWRGDCSGTQKTVSVTLDSDMNCQAQFSPDEDTDGVATSIEDGAPNGGDGNNDGIPDSEQNHVVSIRTPDGKYVTIEEKNGCGINNVQVNEDNLPADGLNLTATPFDYDIDCPEAEIVTYYHDVDELGQHRQYVPTSPGDPNSTEWQDLPTKYNTTTIAGKTVPTATFTLKDGQLGDSSGNDGKIQHTSAMAITPDTVQWSISNYQADEFAKVATIRVTRRGQCQGPITVDYTMADDTANEPDDYLATTGTLTWEDGDCSEKTFTVTIKDDALLEENETVKLTLLNPTGRAIIATPEPALLTIIDDDNAANQGNSCYNAAPCQVCCSACQPVSNTGSNTDASEVKIKSLTTTIEVGETEKITLADGQGELLIKEIPNHTIVSLDAWTPLNAGAGEITLTGQSVGESKMVISDTANPLETVTLYITVIENKNGSLTEPSNSSTDTADNLGANLRIKALQTSIKVGQTLDFTVAGGAGELSISEIPDQSIVLLKNWAPIGETGTAELSLTGLSVGKTKIVISDHSTPPQKTTINIIVVANEGASDPNTGTSTPSDPNNVSPGGTVTQPGDGGISNPTDVTVNGDGSISNPTDVTVNGDGSISNPTDVTVDGDGSVTNPTDVTVDGDGSVTNPTDVTVDGDGSVTNPTDVTVDGDGSVTDPGGVTPTDPSTGTPTDSGNEPTPVYEPTCTNALSIDSDLNLIENQTCFTDNLTVGNVLHPNHGWLTRTKAQNVRLATQINIDPNHQGQSADILMVVVYHTLTADIAYMRDQQTWKIWTPDIKHLPTAQYFHQLPQKTEIFIAEGDFSPMPGEYTSFVGYRLDDGSIIYNGLEPLHFFVGNSASVNMRIPSHKTSGHNELQAASIFEPFIHNQDGKSGNNLTFDYYDNLSISAFVRIQPEHVGQSADLVMVAGYRRHFEPVEIYFMMDSTQYIWSLWDNQNRLPTIQHYPQLPELLEIPIYAGAFGGVAGEYFVYLGYRLNEEKVVFNHTPIQLRIANGIALDTQGERLSTTSYFGSLVYRGEEFGNPFNTTIRQPVGLATTIFVDPKHVGQQADILMVALHHNTEPVYSVEAPRWGSWATSEVSLEASIPNITLEPVLKNIPLFQDQFNTIPGYYTIYVGYRLENGEIVYNGGETLRLGIEP
jgi:hypothetical protein